MGSNEKRSLVMKTLISVGLIILMSCFAFAQQDSYADFPKLLLKPNIERGLVTRGRLNLLTVISDSLGWGVSIKRVNNNLYLIERTSGFTLTQVSTLINNIGDHVEVFSYDHPEEPIVPNDM